MHKNDLLGIFVKHKVAPNLLMIIMILAGLFALKKLNIQFFPNFELDMITVSTVWSGASAEDIETAITIPLEQRLRSIDHLDEMSSSSAPGVSGITLEFEEDTDMLLAMQQVRKQVDSFYSLPADAEAVRVSQSVRYESVARVLISGPQKLEDLRKLARQFEQQLLERGIDKVELVGLPTESIIISVPSAQMLSLGMNLSQIGARVGEASRDLPAGLVGENDSTRELRSLNQRRTAQSLEDLALVGNERNHIRLSDIAHIEQRVRSSAETLSLNGKKTAVLVLRRNENGDSLKAAEILQQWVEEITPTLPPTVTVKVFNERWQAIKQRITLLLINGGGGLILVLLILYAFLSTRVAFWVAVGIPVSFMATLMALYLAGGSINMISLFALIMALGIIVDDAIVVGEDAQAHYDRGEDALKASEGGARRMLAPVLASSLTTIAAFMPLLLVGGRMGNIMSAIPMVIIAVIIASLIESFLILPGHLRHAFVDLQHRKPSALRQRLDRGFEHFRDRLFRPFVRLAIEFRWSTIAFGIAMFIIALGLVMGGKVGWRFFPSPESTTVYANVRFVAGTPAQAVDKFLQHMEQTLHDTIDELDEKVVDTYYVRHGSSTGQGRSIKGERNGSIYVELTAPDSRHTKNRDFMKKWKKRIKPVAGIETFALSARRTGPSSRDLSIRLSGNRPDHMKQASLALAEALKDIPGVSAIDDDLPYGYEQMINSLNGAGEALGLSISSLGLQLRAAFDGIRLQRFQQGADEVEVRIQLPEQERRYLASLEDLPIQLPGGQFVPLGSIASWNSRQGFETLRHANGLLAVTVTADVDEEVNNTQKIVEELRASTLPELASRFDVQYSLEGRAANQRDTLSDMQIGVGIAFAMIYLVLAWVFASYGWPLLVMLTIPLGLTGAVLGHWVMGMDMTLLSLFGFFGLSGIVINDSIILVTFYKHLRASGMAIRQALEEAACQRLRAVLLTSLTTIAGLTPLLFETSRQAQFLIPMVVSIAFGLAYATLLILLIVPSMLAVYEGAHEKLSIWMKTGMSGDPEQNVKSS
jgi:multidrug efflux pump subunit AcrB